MNSLLNLVGLMTGLALYAMLLVMVVRGKRAPGPSDPLPLITALLGVSWNVCALSAYALPRSGMGGSTRLFSIVGFVALGFLPAVVVHSVVRGEGRTRLRALGRVLLWLAYSASSGAAVLQLLELSTTGRVPSVAAMRLLTFAFVSLVVPLTVVTRGQPGGRRALWVAALAVFAVSALHLSQFHDVGNTWPVELVGHHASIPLAVAILYQDFPFALADLFLKRALLLIGLVTAAFFGLSAAGVFGLLSPSQIGAIAVCWVLTALAYPWLRRAISWFVDTILLDRPNYRGLETAFVRRLPTLDTIEMVLEDVRERVTRALSASEGTCRETTDPVRSIPELPLVQTSSDTGVRLLLPSSESPTYELTFNHLTGGRRVLSDDVAALSNIALLAARRIDSIRLARERYERAVREQEVAKLATEAELRALRAQLNPHFLFNALTTINYLIQTAPERASNTLMRLTSLLRAVLRSEGEYTTLGREVDLIEAYLDIEQTRFEDRLRVRIDVPDSLRDVPVPPLLLQPLVENAVKHGISPRRHGGELIVSAALRGLNLQLRVVDFGEGISTVDLGKRQQAGVGLSNVARRLACYYGDRATVRLESTPDRGTVAEISLPLDRPATRPERKAG